MSFAAFRPRTWLGITLFMLFTVIALSDSRDVRFILLAPAAVLFTFHTALYGLEYDDWMRKMRKPPETSGGVASTLKVALLTVNAHLAEATELI